MKRLLLVSFCAFGTLTSFSQIKLEGQIGGANFIGASLNSSFDIALSPSGPSYITPCFGIGFLAPFIDDPTSILHYGLNYQYKRWGVGGEVSGFTASYFFGNGGNGFVDMIVYPNANYTIPSKANWYYKFSAGAYFAFDKTYNFGSDKAKMSFAGDVIPGAGVTIGYRFNIVPDKTESYNRS